jgi:hypothetical protein
MLGPHKGNHQDLERPYLVIFLPNKDFKTNSSYQLTAKMSSFTNSSSWFMGLRIAVAIVAARQAGAFHLQQCHEV